MSGRPPTKNISIAVDRRFFAEGQKKLASGFIKAVREKALESAYITFKESLEELEGVAGIIIAEHDRSLEEELERIGRNGIFKGKFIVLAICGRHDSPELANRILRRYQASGVMWYPYVIDLRAVNLMISEMFSVIDEEPTMVIDTAIAEATRKITDTRFGPEIQGVSRHIVERLKTYFIRIS